jgi:ATP-dependent protease ClpP protease subunit
VHRDIERELILTAEQAREYGLLDTVLSPRNADPPGAR